VSDSYDEYEEEQPAVTVADPVTRTVRLLSRLCDTCVIYADDRMHLGERRTEFIDGARAAGSFVICHDTLGTDTPAICRGFWNRHRSGSAACRIAEGFNLVVEIDPPKEGALPHARDRALGQRAGDPGRRGGS